MDNKGIISLIILTVVVFVFVIIGNALYKYFTKHRK